MKLQAAITPRLVTQPARKPAPQASASVSDAVSTSLSWLGGAASLAGGLSRNPLLLAAGAGAFALGSGMEAHRVNNTQNLDSQFALNVGVAGSLLVGGLALMFLTSGPTAATPVQQFLQQNPGLANLLS
jgi:hypothetical protein